MTTFLYILVINKKIKVKDLKMNNGQFYDKKKCFDNNPVRDEIFLVGNNCK